MLTTTVLNIVELVADIAIKLDQDACLQTRIIAFAKIGRETILKFLGYENSTQYSIAGYVRSNLAILVFLISKFNSFYILS